MINRFIPERTPRELEQRLMEMKRQSGQFSMWSLNFTNIPGFSKRTVLIAAAVLGIFAAGIATWKLTIHHGKGAPGVLGSNVVNRVSGFQPYFLMSSFSTDFKLKNDSVQFNDGVLVFEMDNPDGQSLAFTEEATPPGYDIASLSADKKFTDAFGQGFITDGALRTTGALFTHDSTWILINAPKPIGADLMQQVIDALQPVHR